MGVISGHHQTSRMFCSDNAAERGGGHRGINLGNMVDWAQLYLSPDPSDSSVKAWYHRGGGHVLLRLSGGGSRPEKETKRI